MIEVLQTDGFEYLIDDELSHLCEHEDTISRTMLSAISTHEDDADHFSPLEHDAETFTFQRADCVVALGKAATVKTFRDYARRLYPDFDTSVDRLIDTREDMLNHAADILQRGDDLYTITDHRNVIGVAIDNCIVAAGLYEATDVDHGDIDTHIAVSNMLKYTAVDGFPAVWLLQDVFSFTNFVFPGANPNNRKELPKTVVEDFNKSSNAARKHGSQKPILGAIAGSSTRDVWVSKPFLPLSKKKGYYMGPPSPGTVQEYMTNTYMLTMGHDVSMGDKGLYIGHIVTPTNVAKARLTIMEDIAEGMTEQTGIKSFYEPDYEKFQKIKSQARASS